LCSLNEDKVVLFTPDNKEIYGARTTKEKFSFGSVENKLEGKFRPGHFEGVATVVKKLLKIVCPDKAYFGEKDFQQLLIIKKLVVAIGARTLIVGCPIFREPNGLAMSSRNSLLTKAELQYASKIYNVLKIVKEKFKESSLEIIKKWVLNEFENDTFFKIEYFEITDSLNLEIATSFNHSKKYRAFISGYIRNVRLIDNIALN
jgi:pantoate--beta-alanine ligase